jgi:hypothetical protein
MAGMAVAFPVANREDGVQKQDAVFGPRLERAARRHLITAVLAEFGQDVAQRRRQRAIGRREGESMRPTTPWIRVLTQDYRPDAFEGGSTKGLEHLLIRRVHLTRLALGRNEALDGLEIMRQKPIAENIAPTGRD